MYRNKKGTSNIIRVLNQRLFLNNKRRNIVAILAIIITALMFTTLFTLAQSMSENLISMTFRQTGYDAQVSLKNIEPEQCTLLSNHPDVAEVGESILLGLAENTKLAGRQVEIRWANDIYATHSFGMPTTGRLPTNANEIAVDSIILDRLGIPHEIGQQITLEWRKDLTDYEAARMQSTFTICGFWEGNISSYASMAWVSRDFADKMTNKIYNQDENIFGQYMAQVNLRSDKHIEEDMDRVLADLGLSKLEYSMNLAYSTEMGATALQETLPMYFGMILVLISGYLIIYNIFQICVTADIQFYGKLKTLGTTKQQIKKLLFGQSNRLCLIAIPIGLFLGWLLGMVLVPVFVGVLDGNASTSVNPVIFVGSAVFTWLTVVISCLRPARLAGKVSPLEAMRTSNIDKEYKCKPRKKTKKTTIPRMAWTNLGRNRKRTVIVICSLTLGFVLLSSFYAKNAAFDMEKYLKNLIISDFELSDVTSENYISGYDPQGTTLNSELLENIEALDGIEETGHLYSHQFKWKMDDLTFENFKGFYTSDLLDEIASYDPSSKKSFQAISSNKEISTTIWGMDGIPLKAITQQPYLMEGIFDQNKFSSGKYILAVGPAMEMGEKYSLLPVPSVGSTVLLEGKEYTVMAVVYPLLPISDGASENGLADSFEMQFILPVHTFEQNWPNNTLRKFFIDFKDTHIDEAQKWFNNYTKTVNTSLPITSRQSLIMQYEAETRSSAVMGNTISVVIALVGILNFINSMVTAIFSRKREFAILQSIGMTKRQLRNMLICEGLYYAILTLVASFLISALMVGSVIRVIVSGGFTTFHFTLLPLVICTPILIVFAIVIPYICFKNLEKQSIVERLRATD